ncbi:MAG: hypothetical protein AMS21_00850 [Gemmatimonas sp. SG8_38_2]|nr:MAG: hypothetical protein AMS21_00850 [Gemmatimonas sp. SG8_38_2]
MAKTRAEKALESIGELDYLREFLTEDEIARVFELKEIYATRFTEEQRNLFDTLRIANWLFLATSFLSDFESNFFVDTEEEDIDFKMENLVQGATTDIWIEARALVGGKIPDLSEEEALERLRESLRTKMERDIEQLKGEDFFVRPPFGFPGEDVDIDVLDAIDEFIGDAAAADEIRSVINEIRREREFAPQPGAFEREEHVARLEERKRKLESLIAGEYGKEGLLEIMAHKGLTPEELERTPEEFLFEERPVVEPDIYVTTKGKRRKFEDLTPEMQEAVLAKRRDQAAAHAASLERFEEELPEDIARLEEAEEMLADAMTGDFDPDEQERLLAQANEILKETGVIEDEKEVPISPEEIERMEEERGEAFERTNGGLF